MRIDSKKEKIIFPKSFTTNRRELLDLIIKNYKIPSEINKKTKKRRAFMHAFKLNKKSLMISPNHPQGRPQGRHLLNHHLHKSPLHKNLLQN